MTTSNSFGALTTRDSGRPSSFVVWHGFQANVAHAVAKYFFDIGYYSHYAKHPISKNDAFHEYGILSPGGEQPIRMMKRRFALVIDHLVSTIFPFRLPESSVAVSFAGPTTVRLLLSRLMGDKDQLIVHWNIDFSPRRFHNSILNSAYNFIDKISNKYSDFQVDLTKEASIARLERYRIERDSRHLVVPLGIWQTDLISDFQLKQRLDNKNELSPRIVFLGNLGMHQGILESIEAFHLLHQLLPNATFEIIGSGEATPIVKNMVSQHNLGGSVTIHGSLSEVRYREILRRSTLGLAPYRDSPESFSRFADPGKIKEYLAAGLPVVTTSVPPISKLLQDRNCGLIVKCSPEVIASTVLDFINSNQRLRLFSTNALELAQSYTWETLLKAFTMSIGIESIAKSD